MGEVLTEREATTTVRAPGNAPAPISVFIAVGVRLYRDGLATALKAHERFLIHGSAGTLTEARAAVTELHPDILVVDVSLHDVCEAIRDIRADSPHCRIIAFAVTEDIGAILDYAEA